jgi:hypothetical protein
LTQKIASIAEKFSFFPRKFLWKLQKTGRGRHAPRSSRLHKLTMPHRQKSRTAMGKAKAVAKNSLRPSFVAVFKSGMVWGKILLRQHGSGCFGARSVTQRGGI